MCSSDLYWYADWPTIFKNVAPVDRQVHLRVHSADGLEEKESAVEPMAGMHYLPMSQRHRACRIEIGYYQPADVWNSVATSNTIMMSSAEVSESEQVDLATIPFHLSFQQLVDLFGVNDEAVAAVISRFQTRAVSGGSQAKLSLQQRQILERTGVALSDVADALRAFKQIDREKLRRDAKALLRLGTTSPSRGFDASGWGS